MNRNRKFKSLSFFFFLFFFCAIQLELKAQCPILTLPAEESICYNEELYLSNQLVQVTNAEGVESYIWNTTGTGTFRPGINTLNAVYAPSAEDILAGGVVLTLVAVPFDVENCGTEITSNELALTIHPDPQPAMVITGGQCVGSDFTFTAVSQADPEVGLVNAGTRWDFFDGFVTGVEVVHSFPLPTPQTVTLTIEEDENGCNSLAISQVVEVKSLPTVTFNHSVPSCPNTEIVFEDFSMPPTGAVITLSEWSFDGDDIPEITYNGPSPSSFTQLLPVGLSLVVLRITTSDGCIAQYSKEIKVNEAPFADFEFPEQNCFGVPVQFTNVSAPMGDSPIVSHSWNFGDPMSGVANTSTNSNPIHNFSGSGDFTVTLTIENEDGCEVSISEIVTVQNMQEVTIQPEEAGPYCTGQTIVFNAVGTGLSGHQWSVDGALISTLETLEYLFLDSRTYNVSLSVDGENGCRSYADYQVVISGGPLASFSLQSDTNCVNNTVYFVNESTSPNGGVIETCTWDFGDGSEPETYPWNVNPNASHVYESEGPFTVTLTLLNNSGCEAVTTQTISMFPSPAASFYSDALSTCAGGAIQFHNTTQTTSGSTIWNWIFVGGSGPATITSVDQHPLITFDEPGSYTATLTAIDSLTGCQNTFSMEEPIVVSAPIIATIILDSPTVDICSGTTIVFSSDAAVGSELNWFIDGTPFSGEWTFIDVRDYLITLSVINGGCTSESDTTIRVHALPQANFMPDQSSVCLSSEIEFTSTSTSVDEIVSWVWDFGDGNGSSQGEATETYTYLQTGTYSVSLTVETSFGCEHTSELQSITIHSNPTANFDWEGTCAESDIMFVANGSYSNDPENDIYFWEWNFNDGTPVKYGDTVTRSDMTEGSHNVILTVRNENTECTAIREKTIEVSEAIDYAITIDDVEISETVMTKCVGADVAFEFEQNSGEEITNYQWDFGDGTPIVANANPTAHNFEAAGTYTIVLDVSTASGCRKTSSFDIVIRENPVANFATDESNCTQQNVVFTNVSAPYNGGGGLPSYFVSLHWNFGDGHDTIVENMDNPEVIHVYDFPASSYNVKLNVEDNYGCIDSIIKPIRIESAPIARFVYNDACLAEPVLFTDNSTPDNGPHIVAWEWDFGDPASGNHNSSALQNPSHQFSQVGEYQVQLVVTNELGCVDTIVEILSQNPCFEALYDVSGNMCANDSVCFENLSSISTSNGTIRNCIWDFGDGTIEEYSFEEKNICHVYSESSGNNYTVVLTLEAEINDLIFTQEYSQDITVNPSPTAILNSKVLCQFATENISDESLSNSADYPIVSWTWAVNGTTQTTDVNNIDLVFDEYGQFNMQLTVANQLGCIDTISAIYDVSQAPTATFITQDSCATFETTFISQSIEGGGALSEYHWTFGDGNENITTDTVTTYVYNRPQSNEQPIPYEVVLAVVDDKGCRSSDTNQLMIYPIPIADFTYDEDVDGKKGNLQFNNLSSGLGYDSCMWIFSGDTIYEQSPLYLFETDGPHLIELYAMNEFGCYQYKSETYELKFIGLYFPNMFVPDSENPEINTFSGKGVNLEEYTLEIFSRWGQLLWSSSELIDGAPAEAWDGTYDGQKMPMGIYLWRATAKFNDGTLWEGSDNSDGNLNPYGIINLIR